MSKVDRKKIALYFKGPKPWKGAIFALLVGGMVFAVGINEKGASHAIPVGAFLIMLGFGISVLSPSRPSEKKMDAWLDMDLKRIAKHALEKTNLRDEDLVSEDGSVFVIGPRFWSIAGAKIGFRKGKDNNIRYTPVGVTIIYFTEHQLVGYQCALDFYTGQALNESSDEYFYKDIVSVTTKTESETFHLTKSDVKAFKGTSLQKLVENKMLHLKMAEKFVLTTSGGTSIEVVLSDPNLEELGGGGILPKDRADAAVRAVRKMLREKKVV